MVPDTPQGRSKEKNKQTRPSSPLPLLQEQLRLGLAVVTEVWKYEARDWITSVHAEDIDNDGDIEILLGSRDGYVRAITRGGSKKWKTQLGAGQWVSSVIAVPQAEWTTALTHARVIAGSRDGKVYALDQSGNIIPDWGYDTGQVVRQLYINPGQPGQVIVGSEDRCIHVLDSVNGRPLWEKYATNDWIRSVFSADIDGDGKIEILAGSGDKHLYILDEQGQLKGKLFTRQKIGSLFATRLLPEGPIEILASSDGKDLYTLTLTSENEAYSLSAQYQDSSPEQKATALKGMKRWSKTQKDDIFENRIHSIYAADINDDGNPEIIIGSEDQHIYILDQQGNLLWKHNLGCCIYSVYALDYDYDGMVEILVGAQDNNVHVFRVELPKVPLYHQIEEAYRAVKHTYNRGLQAKAVIEALTHTEYTLLRDILHGDEHEPHQYMELDSAFLLIRKRAYDKALPILLKLQQQKVQHYWARPRDDLGHIRALSFGDIAGNPIEEIIVGTDKGSIHAIDIEHARKLWKTSLEERVWMLQMGTMKNENYETIFACLANRHVYKLDNKGKILHSLRLQDSDDWIGSIYINKQKDGTYNEVVIGTENNRIYIYDPNLEQRLATIYTPQPIKIVCTHDITGQGRPEVIGGALDGHVYVYNRDSGVESWRYKTGDRVRALHAADIDGDGQVEVIVGSEDRNVYVLDNQGHLKWRYFTPHRVLDVDALDIDGDGRCEILLGVADGYLYTLSGEGDLLWKYKAPDRIRAAHARDLNNDGHIEIAIGSEDRLELLQVVAQQELDDLLQRCWDALLQNIQDYETPKRCIYKHLEDANAYVRAFALMKLAAWPELTREDFAWFEAALKDRSVEVRKALAQVLVSLYQSYRQDDSVLRQLRRLLQKLSAASEQEVRLAFVGALPALTAIHAQLGFEYLERFTHNVDQWVRRAVVRQLYLIAEQHPHRTFPLLLTTARDREPWVRQEAGRSLAHYFDLHSLRLLNGTHYLLTQSELHVSVLEQIAASAREPVVRHIFTALARLVSPQLNAANVAEVLAETVSALREASQLGILHGQETLQIYEQFQQLLQARSIMDIAQFQRVIAPEQFIVVPRFAPLSPIFAHLLEVVQTLRIYQRREALGDQAASLIKAITGIEEIRYEVRDLERQHRDQRSLMPEDPLLTILLQRWYDAVMAELHRLRGEARLEPQIQTHILRHDEQVTVSLLIYNNGRCPADNVRIFLEVQPEFEIVRDQERALEEVSTQHPAAVDFTILPHADVLRLAFTIIYNDAERRDRELHFADRVILQSAHTEFHEIPNPYQVGTPVRGSEMFFGREEDLNFLREILTSPGSNRVVVLSGQRRSGKTSLIYQLVDNPALLSPHIPVFIDMQAFALKSTVDQLLEAIASDIYDTLEEKALDAPPISRSDFARDPTGAFDLFLKRTVSGLAGNKLILLIDEFEALEEKIADKELDRNFLKYLRSLMQHCQGINFVLAGTPRIRHLTDGYWSIFFNIAQHHALSRLSVAAATRLITEPVRYALEYDPLALEKMHDLTGDQPYLLHMLSEAIIRHCNRQRRTYVTINEVLGALGTVLERGTNHFGWIWNQSSTTERVILSIIAQAKGDEGRVFSLIDIADEYAALGLTYEQERVTQALQHLIQEDFIEERLDGTQFKIPVGLTRAWLRTARPPVRVVREEQLLDLAASNG